MKEEERRALLLTCTIRSDDSEINGLRVKERWMFWVLQDFW